MNRLKFYLRRIYRLSVNFQKREEIVWSDLKKLHADAGWNSGIYENDKYIRTVFEISNEQGGVFYYSIYGGYFHCRVKILEDFPVDLTTDLFILSAHFNNLLNEGKVIVNVNSQYVEFHLKSDLLVPLLYTSEIYSQLNLHCNTAKDIYSAFQRLVNEQEAPAIIIADLLKQNEQRD